MSDTGLMGTERPSADMARQGRQDRVGAAAPGGAALLDEVRCHW
jgi:hypothetical protein